MLEAPARPAYCYFFFICFLARSMSLTVHNRTRIPPMTCTRGALTFFAAMYRCNVIRLILSLFAASRDDKAFILL